MAPEPVTTLQTNGGHNQTSRQDDMTPAATLNPPKNNHPDLVRIDWQEGSYASSLRAVKAFAKGDIICSIDGTAPGPKRWSSVQVGRSEHIELCSDLLYMNHSCDPNVFLDLGDQQSSKNGTAHSAENGHGASSITPSGHIGQLVAIKAIAKDDPISFFYPSTEWEMDQPFQCHCGSTRCLGYIQGASQIPKDILQGYQTNRHIDILKSEQR